MALVPSNSSNLQQLALKGLTTASVTYITFYCCLPQSQAKNMRLIPTTFPESAKTNNQTGEEHKGERALYDSERAI